MLKDEQNIIENNWLDTRPENLHTFEIIWRIFQVFISTTLLVIGTFRFYVQIYISDLFGNLVRAFFG